MGEFQEKLETIQFMMCSPLKARHWEVIQQLPGNKVVNPTVLTIQTLGHLKVVFILMHVQIHRLEVTIQPHTCIFTAWLDVHLYLPLYQF